MSKRSNRDSPRNAAELAFRNPRDALLEFINRRIPVAPEALASEIQRMLGGVLYAWLNREGSPSQAAEYIGTLLYATDFEPQESTRLADSWMRVARLDDDDLVSQLLGPSYRWWQRYLGSLSLATDEGREVRAKHRFDEHRYQEPDLEPVLDFAHRVRERLGGYCCEFVIHGSLSDLQRTPYSDLDTWMVVNWSTLDSAEALLSLRCEVRELCEIVRRFDPLQHHGIFVAAEPDLLAYREARFPLLLLDTATSLLDRNTLSVRCAEDSLDRAYSLAAMAARVLGVTAIPTDPYNVKMFTSWLMLLPTMVHQFTTGYCYKPDSFELVRSEFSPLAWSAVEAAGQVRQRWGEQDARQLVLSIDPHLCDGSQALANEILQKLDSSDIHDSIWERIDLGSRHDELLTCDPPIYYSRAEFDAVCTRAIGELSAVEGVQSVWTFGSVASPTEGISDLDLLVVLDADSADSPVGIEALKRVRATEDLSDGGPSRALCRYIRCHSAVTFGKADATALKGFWLPAPSKVAGTSQVALDVPLEEDVERQMHTILLFKEGFFQLLKMLELIRKPRLYLRLALLRAYTVVHDIRIARRWHGIEDENLDLYERLSQDLRNTWFTVPHRERNQFLDQLLSSGVVALHRLVNEIARQLVEEGVIDLTPLGETPRIRQCYGECGVLFEGTSTHGSAESAMIGPEGALHFDLSVLVMANHCRPPMPMSPSPRAEVLDACLEESWRHLANGVRRAANLSSQLATLLDRDEPSAPE